MNVAVINLRDIFKFLIKFLIITLVLFTIINYSTNHTKNLDIHIDDTIFNKIIIYCIKTNLKQFDNDKTNMKVDFNINSILSMELPTFNNNYIVENNETIEKIEKVAYIPETTETAQEISPSPDVKISSVSTTEAVQDRNYNASFTDRYMSTTIDNQSNYDLTEDMLVPDVEITNKKQVLIYHTHTCESYTPSENYYYEMTGNYRTTDSNYNVVRVGRELKSKLEEKGFEVIHDETYHDYPSYSGSYARSLQTAENILFDKDIDIVIDLHRDAMGNGDTYGPTLMVNDQRVAQLMFVIGTDGGGLEHPNWVQNLKIAIKIQEAGNQMYPGIFRPIIIRNSRYNQHLAKGASIIEVGATANTMEECLLSMQCLANILDKVCE